MSLKGSAFDKDSVLSKKLKKLASAPENLADTELQALKEAQQYQFINITRQDIIKTQEMIYKLEQKVM